MMLSDGEVEERAEKGRLRRGEVEEKRGRVRR